MNSNTSSLNSQICPNDKQSFTDILYKIHLLDPLSSNETKAYTRRQIYYTICIFTRLAIAGLIFQKRNSIYTPYILILFSLFSIINLYPFSFVNRSNAKMWWSSRYQFIIALLIFIFSFIGIIFKDNFASYTWIYAALMYLSVFGGLFQSLLIPSC